MVRYRCIGYGTTNGNGVATLERDLSDNSISGYTGQGVGLVDFVASAESPNEINSSSDVSETYTIYDVLYQDMTNGVETTNTLLLVNCSYSVEDGVKTITNTATSGWSDARIASASSWASVITFNSPYCVELVVTDVSNRFILGFQTGSNSVVYTDWLTQTGSYRIEVRTGELKVFKDGTQVGTTKTDSNLGSSSHCKISLESPTHTISYHDLRVYPI